MDCKTIIFDWLRAHNFDGLCEPAIECGCGLDDFAPCGDGPFPSCQPAMKRVLGDGEYFGDCEPGDTVYAVEFRELLEEPDNVAD